MIYTGDIASSRMVAERWRNTFIGTEKCFRQAATHDAMRRIDRLVAEELPEACARRLAPWFETAGDGVWRIRELDLNFILDIAKVNCDEIAAAWSERLAAKVTEIIGQGLGADGIVYFASYGAYLSRFVLDLIAGRAWSKWYYEEFQPLEMLSKGRIIAEVLAREPKEGMRVIVHFAEIGRLDDILAVMTDADAELIYRCCFARGPDLGPLGLESASPNVPAGAADGRWFRSEASHASGMLSLWAGRLIEAWKDQPARAAGFAETKFHHAIRWLALVAARFPGVELDAAACEAADGWIELRRILVELRSAVVADRLVRRFVEGTLDIEEALQMASERNVASPGRGLRFLLSTAQGDSDWAVEAAAVLLRDQLPAAQAVLYGESMITDFGGIFLLGPGLVAANEILETAVGTIDQADEVASFLRYVTLIKCLGSRRTLEATSDHALRLFSGCLRNQLDEGRRACATLDLACALRHLLRNLPAFADCGCRCLVAEEIAVAGRNEGLLLLRDAARNDWVYGTQVPESSDREQALASALELIHESTGNMPSVLLHPSLADLRDSAALRQRADRLLAMNRESPEVAESLVATGGVAAAALKEKWAQLLAPSSQEFDYFSSANGGFEFDIVLDVFGALLSRAVMKKFARRLMGFQNSSPEHLYRNFLAGVGTVRSHLNRIAVELPSSPLFVVLQLSGLTRQSYALPWLKGKEVCLLPPKE